MANLNKIMLIGRLTRDPEVRAFPTSKVCRFDIAVNDRVKNPTTGVWEDVPEYFSCSVWQNGEGSKMADTAAASLRKGHQVFVEGRVKIERWQKKDGSGEGSKNAVRVSNFQFLEKKTETTAAPQSRQTSPPSRSQQREAGDEDIGNEEYEGAMSGDIPF